MPDILQTDYLEQREDEKRRAISRRVRVLVILFVGVVCARIFIKNPPPPKSPPHTGEKFRALPGMLDRIPEAQRAKIKPELLAEMKEADTNARLRVLDRKQPAAAVASVYKAPQAPVGAAPTEPIRVAKLSGRRHKTETAETKEPIDVSKTMLVLFRSGGYVTAQQVERHNSNVHILLDKTMFVSVPGKIVHSISNNALEWKPPFAAGQVQLKPAKGITIVLDRRIAGRITVKDKGNEI